MFDAEFEKVEDGVGQNEKPKNRASPSRLS